MLTGPLLRPDNHRLARLALLRPSVSHPLPLTSCLRTLTYSTYILTTYHLG